jgi:hypothetical protein
MILSYDITEMKNRIRENKIMMLEDLWSAKLTAFSNVMDR